MGPTSHPLVLLLQQQPPPAVPRPPAHHTAPAHLGRPSFFDSPQISPQRLTTLSRLNAVVAFIAETQQLALAQVRAEKSLSRAGHRQIICREPLFAAARRALTAVLRSSSSSCWHLRSSRVSSSALPLH